MRPQLLAACLLTGTSHLPAQPRHLATVRWLVLLFVGTTLALLMQARYHTGLVPAVLLRGLGNHPA